MKITRRFALVALLVLGATLYASPARAGTYGLTPTGAETGAAGQLSAGFQTCAALFCAAPLAIFGSVQDGLSEYYYPLAVKAVMDGLATLGLPRTR